MAKNCSGDKRGRVAQFVEAFTFTALAMSTATHGRIY
jgi:hypothetical protein